MPFKKLYDLFTVVCSDTGKFIDQLIDGSSPWPRRYQWLASQVNTSWERTRKLPALGKTPTTTMTLVCLMTIFFYLVGVYCVLTGIRIPLFAQQPGAPLDKILITSLITGACIGLSFGEGLRLMRHAGRLWRRAPLLAKAQTMALFMCASAGAVAMPLLPLLS